MAKKEPNLSFDKAKFIKQFASSQLKFTWHKIHLLCEQLTAPEHKQWIQNYF